MPTVMNHEIRFKCSKSQIDLAKNKAQCRGVSLAEFCRERILGSSLILEQQVTAIYKAICQNKNLTKIQKQDQKVAELLDYATPEESYQSPAYEGDLAF